MQAVVGDVGADKAPLFLRMGRAGGSRHQPVGISILLKELPHIHELLGYFLVTGAEFYAASGELLGAAWGFGDGLIAGADGPTLHATPDGLALTVAALPPPVGFRSEAGLAPGHFRCYFREIQITPGGWQGLRTEAMGGSGQPVNVPSLPLPPVTRWDTSRIAGSPQVGSICFIERPALEVFADELHALTAAATECLRLKRPLHVTHE
jgi:hypothetical protein